MKVLDLQCGNGHVFEGWFTCEADFLAQCGGGLVCCPTCGDPSVFKKLSAPRLNLGSHPAGGEAGVSEVPATTGVRAMSNAWLEIARQVVAQTADVGDHFAEEARKIHYQEVAARGIRGTATLDETRHLLEEGIEVQPLFLPEALKGTLQ